MKMNRLSAGLTMALLLCGGAAGAESEAPPEPQNQPAGESGWSIDWYKIASGGTIAAHGGGWTLGGTIGQHDDTAAEQLQGGPWSLTGGFWAADLDIDHLGTLFRDRFED